MFESRFASTTGAKKQIRYEPIERRRGDRRNPESERRSEPRSDGSMERRKSYERRK